MNRYQGIQQVHIWRACRLSRIAYIQDFFFFCLAMAANLPSPAMPLRRLDSAASRSAWRAILLLCPRTWGT